MQLQHKDLKDKKNVAFCTGLIQVPYIGKQGHFQVSDRDAEKILIDHPYSKEPNGTEHGIVAEGKPGYVEETLGGASGDNKLNEIYELKVQVRNLTEKNAELQATIDGSKDAGEIETLTKKIAELQKDLDELLGAKDEGYADLQKKIDKLTAANKEWETNCTGFAEENKSLKKQIEGLLAGGTTDAKGKGK